MSKGSGTISSSGSKGKSKSQTPEEYNAEIGVDVQSIKEGLQGYSHIDRWNNSSAYRAGFNDSAVGLIEDLAKGDYGLATEIAKQAVNRPNFDKYGVSLSEKQAYVLAKAAYDNKVLKSNHTIFDKNIREKVQEDARRKASAKAAKYEAYNKTYQRSTTKVAVGSEVKDSKGRAGTITSIITKSSGYVTVKYADGTVRKEMAFNLYGADGNPLKKRPKN